jgi:GTP pyrophosphokinase
VRRQQQLLVRCEAVLKRALADLLPLAREADPVATLSGRVKSPESTRAKMRAKKLTAAQVADRVGVRVIVSGTDECYGLADRLTARFPTNADEYDDYILVPKPNGYRSLHILLAAPGLYPVEVQIRTPTMDDLAELGEAAHWRYKRGFGS